MSGTDAGAGAAAGAAAPVDVAEGSPHRHAEREQWLKGWRQPVPGSASVADGGASTGATLDRMRATARTSHAGKWTEVADCDLESVTPIYGGGVEAGRFDPLLPFRPRAIKNLLRHWWWLSHRRDEKYKGAGGSQQLFEDMVALWGGAAREGEDRGAKVRLRVTLVTESLEEHMFTYLPYRPSAPDRRTGLIRAIQKTDDPWLYALFPAKGENKRVAWSTFQDYTCLIDSGPAKGLHRLLQGGADALFEDGKAPGQLLAAGVKFRLEIEVADASRRPVVEDALRAWLLFGGVGARTTRGLGRLSAPKSITCDDVKRIEGKLGLREDLSWWGTPSDPTSAWKAALSWYREFRQLRLPGHKRSYWPKADVIRALTDRDMNGHHAVHHRAVTTGEARQDPDTVWPFPEVHFGAPIILKFKDEMEGDPYAVELVPARSAETAYDRFSSPVLTIPWWDVGARTWRPRIVALPYEDDLTAVGVCVRKSGEGEDGAVNVFKYLSNDEGKTAYLEPGAWWPAKKECGEAWGPMVDCIWRGTPGGDQNAKILRAMGAVDPVEALFKFLDHRRAQ